MRKVKQLGDSRLFGGNTSIFAAHPFFQTICLLIQTLCLLNKKTGERKCDKCNQTKVSVELNKERAGEVNLGVVGQVHGSNLGAMPI